MPAVDDDDDCEAAVQERLRQFIEAMTRVRVFVMGAATMLLLLRLELHVMVVATLPPCGRAAARKRASSPIIGMTQ